MRKSFPHMVDAIETPRLMAYIESFPEKKRLEYYAMFWLIVESLFKNKNEYNFDKNELISGRGS